MHLKIAPEWSPYIKQRHSSYSVFCRWLEFILTHFKCKMCSQHRFWRITKQATRISIFRRPTPEMWNDNYTMDSTYGIIARHASQFHSIRKIQSIFSTRENGKNKFVRHAISIFRMHYAWELATVAAFVDEVTTHTHTLLFYSTSFSVPSFFCLLFCRAALFPSLICVRSLSFLVRAFFAEKCFCLYSCLHAHTSIIVSLLDFAVFRLWCNLSMELLWHHRARTTQTEHICNDITFCVSFPSEIEINNKSDYYSRNFPRKMFYSHSNEIGCLGGGALFGGGQGKNVPFSKLSRRWNRPLWQVTYLPFLL